ncbi:MAG: tetratricopeptide repeat protein [bacterium]
MSLIAGLITGTLLVAVATYKFLWSSSHSSLDVLPAPDLKGVEVQVEKKISFLRLKVQEKPNSASTWGKLGMNFAVHEMKREAVVCYRQAADLNPREFLWPYYCGITLRELGSPEALDWLERSLAIKPQYAPLNVLYGQTLLDAGKVNEAREAFRRSIKVDQNLPHAYHGLAQISLAENNLQLSLEYLLKALEIDPSYREAHGLLADVYRRLGKPAKARGQLLFAQQLPEFTWMPDPYYSQLAAEGVSSWWYRRRGRAYLEKGLYQSAVREFRMRLLLKPDAQSHNNLAIALQKLGQRDEAIEQLQAALALDPGYVDALNNLAAVLYEEGRKQEAMTYLDKALKLNPAFADAYLNLGAVYMRAGKTEKGLAAFRQGLTQSPDHLKLTTQLAWVLATTRQSSLRDGEEAVQLGIKVCEMTNYLLPGKLDVLAAAYAEQGRFDKAISIGRQAYELAKSNHPDLAKQIQRRLKLYEAKKPYRE